MSVTTGPLTQGWRDLHPVSRIAMGAEAPTIAAMVGGHAGTRFDDNSRTGLHFTFHPNHDHRLGSLAYLHVHWAPDTSSTGVVDWRAEITVARTRLGPELDGDGIPLQSPGPFSYEVFGDPVHSENLVLAQAGCGTALAHQVAEVPLLAALTEHFEPDAIIKVYLYRDAHNANAADTHEADVWFESIDIHYQIDQFATQQRLRGTGWAT